MERSGLTRALLRGRCPAPTQVVDGRRASADLRASERQKGTTDFNGQSSVRGEVDRDGYERRTKFPILMDGDADGRHHSPRRRNLAPCGAKALRGWTEMRPL